MHRREGDAPGDSQRIAKATEEFEKVGFYCGLHLLGDETAYRSLLDLLQSPSYHARCSVANCIDIYISSSHYEEIKGALDAALAREETIAAQSSIESALQYLEENRASIFEEQANV